MITATRPSGPRGELDRSVSLNVPASAGLRSGSGQPRRSKRIFDPAAGADIVHLRISLTRHVLRVSLTRHGCMGHLRQGRGPGHPFGPEFVPSATGSSSVVYWVPGPLPGPTPRPAGS